MSLKGRVAAAVLAAMLIGFTFVIANAKSEEPTTKPVKLIKPWSELKDLTPDQESKIHEIHTAFLKAQHELEVKQHEDIMAVLSDAQKTELEKQLAGDKKAAAERRHSKAGATTQPAK